MTEEITVKPSLQDDVKAQIEQITVAASAAETAEYDRIVKLAHTGSPASEVLTLAPAVAGLIFLESNKVNRDWRAARSQSLARQMLAGEWVLHGQGLQFYQDGSLADGQHRTAACALSGVSIPISVFYGLNRKAIVNVDAGVRRSAADALQLDGVQHTKEMQALVIAANTYEMKAKVPDAVKLESTQQVYDYMSRNRDQLARAIEIGARSGRGIVSPILTSSEASKVAYLLAKNGWDEDLVAAQLAFFQAGQDESDSSPMYKVATAISTAKARKSGRTLTAGQMIALVVQAFRLTEKGVRAIQNRTLEEVKTGKVVPDPRYTI